MKTRLILLVLFFGMFQIGFSQDVKIKKKIAYVDGVAFLKYRLDYGKIVISTMDNKDLILVNEIEYEIPNPAYENVHNPNRYKYSPTLKRWYFIISFIDIEMEYEADINLKGLFSALYKFKVVNDDGSIQTENAEKMKKMIAQDVSSTIPKVVIHK